MSELTLSIESTCEEVAEYFSKRISKISKDIIQKLIDEGISGDVLLKVDFKVLGVGLKVSTNIKNILKENQARLTPKNIPENISIRNEEEIKSFFEKYIGFKGDTSGIKEENELKSLNEENMKKLGLNLGQRIRLLRYIEYFNSLNEKDIEVKITNKSSKEDVINYLKNELNISEDSINKNDLYDAEFLFQLNETILNDDVDAPPEEKKMLLKFIKKIQNKNESISITEKSSKDDIIKFMKEKINFDYVNQDISELNIDKNEKLTLEEKDIISKFLNENKKLKNADNNIDDFEEIKPQRLIKKEFKESNEIEYLAKTKEAYQKFANFNIFFILCSDTPISDIELAVFQNANGSNYINYDFYLIDISKNIYGNNKLYLFQVVSDKQIKKLFINARIKDDSILRENIDIILESEIEIKGGYENAFILEYLESKSTYNYFTKISDNDYITEYLNFFFSEDNKNMSFITQKNLLEKIIIKIYNEKSIELSAQNILIFLYKCGDFRLEPEGLNNVKIIGKEKFLDKKYYIDNNFVKKNFGVKYQNIVLNTLMDIYSKYDIDKLLELVSYDDECAKIFFDLLFTIRKILFAQLERRMTRQKEQTKKLQSILIKAVSDKNSLQFVIIMGTGIENFLNIINAHLVPIIKIVDKEKKPFIGLMWNNPDDIDNIENIVKTFKEINNKVNIDMKREYKLLAIDDNKFDEMIEKYKNKELDDYLLLKELLGETKIDTRIMNKYYQNIHNKGMSIIRDKEKKMTNKQIIEFIVSKDVFYYKEQYSSNVNRDPDIFKYIHISSDHEDYKENIELIKNFKLYNLYNNSPNPYKIKFYKAFLEQIHKFNDIINIFEIFPLELIKENLKNLIDEKIKELLITAPTEENLNSYNIINFWILSFTGNGENYKLYEIANSLSELNKFAYNYYCFLINKKENELIYVLMKDSIISFMIEFNKNDIINDEILISLLKGTSNEDFVVEFFKKIEKKILTEEDFYSKIETKNFKFYKLFQKNLYNEKKELIGNCDYVNESEETRNKIIGDLKNNNISYEKIINLMSDENSFLNKIRVIIEDEAENILQNLKESLNKCKEKFSQLDLIKTYYDQFYKETKKNQITLIKNKLIELKKLNISTIISEDNFFKNNPGFDLDKALEDSKNIKYGNSKFFMEFYEKNKENYKKSEEERFKISLDKYREILTNIIMQKEKKIKFFEIENIDKILGVVIIHDNNLQDEIQFTIEEFKDLNQEEYIKNDLLNDLISYSKKDKVSKLLEGIKIFIEAYEKIENIELTEYSKEINNLIEKIDTEDVNKEEINEAIKILMEKGFDIKEETSLIKFYNTIKKDAIIFLKDIRDSHLEIRNLNEFVVENAASELQTSDIDNLIYVFEFFNTIFTNKEVKTDKSLIEIFGKEMNNNPEILGRIQSYQNVYGEIKRVYQLFHENPVVTIEKIKIVVMDSSIDICKDNATDYFTFKMNYKHIIDNVEKNEIIDTREIEELRNKILLSSKNSNSLNKQNEDNEEQIIDKEKMSKEYINLIDDLKQLTLTLNSLLQTGYPYLTNLKLNVKNFITTDENGKVLKDIMEDYKKKNSAFKNSLKEAYEKFPLLRLFYSQQFIQLYNQVKHKNSKNIFHLINSVCLNQINNHEIEYEYNDDINELENINNYLEELFKLNNLSFDQLFKKNQVLEEKKLTPGLYRRVKSGENNDIIEHILNIYLNLTNSIPVINTLFICNEDTSIEGLQAFLYRAIFCNEPTLFVITNIECLEFTVIKSFIKMVKILYKEKKNRKINSYVLIMYEKVQSGLTRFVEKFIPEKNKLDGDIYIQKPKKECEEFKKIDLYSADFSGYGKTTEIKNKVKNKKGQYFYLPIGGTFTRDYLIQNLFNLNIDIKKGEENYLHLDLSETDNDDLMVETLFKLIILRYLDSKRNIYYLGYDIHLILEIPKGFYQFDKKYKLLNLFNIIHIDKLYPLRLEENAIYIKDSPIAIVAEVLNLYDKNEIKEKNIDLDAKISKTAEEYEKIINKYFNVDNQNYYQKMNFIKILSIQFTKFTNNIYFDHSIIEQDDGITLYIIENIRPIIISNFITLTKIFTRSPYDTVLLRQNSSIVIFGQINEKQAKEEEIKLMANESNKQEVFSFQKIQPSLVFFNKDGNSLSIISNIETEKNYRNLKFLWNSGESILANMNPEQLVLTLNHDPNHVLKELIDYKNLSHEEFLEQIRIIFDFKKLSVKDLKEICIKSGNYIFVADNFIKMVRILLNIEAKIPVILMGETGVGKTKLLEMLATLYGGGTPNWHKLQIHAGITDQKIVEFIEDVNKKYEEQKDKNKSVWIFFDEINTCNSLGLITEIMCNHTYLGKKINDNFIFLAACNPYRVITKKMKESGLIYHNTNEKNKLNNLVYTVNPLPHSLLNFIFDFGSLQPEDEEKYIKNTIIDIMARFKNNKIIEDFDKISKDDLDKIQNEIIQSIVICHKFLREIIDRSSVSLREIRRFGIFFEYFIKYFNGKDYASLKNSLNMTLYLCYYLRLNERKYRELFIEQLKDIFNDFLLVPENEVNIITKEMTIDKDGGIALNRALKENLFTCLTCIDNSVPLIIVGKPGTGKSLSFQILYNTLKGEYSNSEKFKKKGKLYRYYYQGSGASTSEGIEQVFEKAVKAKKNNEKSVNKIITLVFFDEMGLAERSINNPLKIIHYLLEKDTEDSVPFLGISNWKLDAAKINRALNLSITQYDPKDLEETANTIAKSLNKNIASKNNDFFETLAKTYYEYIEYIQGSIKENKDFHGNRDFYNLIKTSMKELIDRKDELTNNKNKLLTEAGLHALDRNFSGLEVSNIKIKELFKKLFQSNYDPIAEYEKPFSVLDVIKTNISNSSTRYLMLISEGSDGRDIVKFLLNSENRGFIELIGSKYKSDIKSNRYSEEILNKIKYIMETDNILILKDLDMVYPSLYDLFNQNFTLMGEKKFARIAFEYAKISSEVNKDFHVIVLVSKSQIEKLKIDPPFLNRFEKHIINFNIILDERDISIAKKIRNYIELIGSFNDNPNLKIDLNNLLINCQLHNIQGLIFKIKNTYKDRYEWLKKEGIEYEENLIKEVFKIIVPTFCQDIIASMINSGIKQNNYNDIVLDIYNKSTYLNFVSFFNNIRKRRNIIYTFSPITKDIFKTNYFKINKCLKNEFGIFDKQSIKIEMIESFKSESDLSYILKTFTESEDKNLFILRFSEKDLDKMSSIHNIIDYSEKEYPKLKEKLIILIIHKQRLKREKKIRREDEQELISFFNDDYYQIFIDNLHGKENLDIFKILQNNSDIVAEQYIYNPEFIKSKIFMVINYLNCKILFETKEINKRNYISKLTELIINNKFLQDQIITNLKTQGKKFKNSIKDIFLSDTNEINDIDFIEVISSKLSITFCKFLLRIIYASLNDNILNCFLINKDINSLLKNDYFKNLVTGYFEKPIILTKNLKMDINANQISIYNSLKIPQSRQNINKLIKYFNENCKDFSENEDSLRKRIKDDKGIIKKEKCYKENLEKYKKGLKNQIMKIDFFKEIFNLNLKELLLDDYLVFFIIKYSERKNIEYESNIKLLNFLKLLIKIKLDTCEYDNKFENNIQDPLDEFVTIFIFTQGYMKIIKEFLDKYLDVINFCDNFDEIMKNYLNEKKIKYEESKRCKSYTKSVNICLFNIIESFIRAMLLYSQELINNDKNKFMEFFRIFFSIENSFENIDLNNHLFSKEMFNLQNIIKIEETYKNNHEQFENNYNKIIDNLLLQSTQFYCGNFDKLKKNIFELIGIFDQTFKEKNDSYANLVSFIYKQEYQNINNDEIRIELLEKFFSDKSLLKYSKIFLVKRLIEFKPKSQELDDNKGKKTKKKQKSPSELILEFMDIEGENFEKIKNIINILNKKNSPEFNEILLYFFEGLCQSYFLSIYKKNKDEYSDICCIEMLLGLSLGYLKKAIQFLYEHKEDNNNNLLKLYAIAYIKSYCYFYVEIHKNHYEKIPWDEINKILFEKDEKNESIIKMRNIYLLRLYNKTFPDFEQFINYDFKSRNLPILGEIAEKISNESITEGYVFNESFINPKVDKEYKSILQNIEDNDIKIDLINDNLDTYYCCLVNKTLSFKLGKNKEKISLKMKEIYDSTKDGINLGTQIKILYNYLLNNALFENEIENKITKKPLTTKNLEILLYSLRFIFNTKENNNNFYYNLLKPNAHEFIKNNFIPGSFQIINEFFKSYKILSEKLKLRIDMGYYVCKDCGFLYEVEPCTFPTMTFKDINGHFIGGDDHILFKKDIRVFYEKADYDRLVQMWITCGEWIDSFEPMMNLQEFKEKYVNANMPITEKGIIKNYEKNNFEGLEFVRDMDIITFRLLNFILYSYLFASHIMKSLSNKEINDYLITGYEPDLFIVIQKNWELLEMSLKEKGVENASLFMNMIFDKIMEMINSLESVDTTDKLNAFEKEINQYILDLLSKKENVDKMNEDYQNLNKKLNNISPNSIKEIIKSSFDPSEYDQNKYPDIQYYSVSSLQNLESFINKFKSSEKNEQKYFLTHLLINKDQEITKDTINLKHIENLNNLGNILINIFSYKISRDEAKKVKLNQKLSEINELYNKINQDQVELSDEDKFKQTYIEPFIKSWDQIKSKSVQYKCIVLRNGNIEGKPLDISIDSKLSYFLADIGDQDGGIFLASAYEHLIEWQNRIINIIIEKNKNNGILNSYIPQLEKEIFIQDATENDIININDKTYEKFEKYIMYCSMRNIFTEDGKIDYKNYYDNNYDYDYIEKELAKIILQDKKKFKVDKIKFIVYKYEEFKGENSSILIDYNEKYPKKELSNEEKSALDYLVKNNGNINFYQNISSSLQIIMKQIIADNYDSNILIYEVLKSFPSYIILNEELKEFLANEYENNRKMFAINTLISIFEYFENLCWDETKKHISADFKLKLKEDDKQYILDYFEKNKYDDKKIININNFTTALRRLISRFLLSSRQEAEIKSDLKLSHYIGREELWKKEIIDNELFIKEIMDICTDNIKIGNSFNLYEILGGDKILKTELGIKCEDENCKEDNEGIAEDKNDVNPDDKSEHESDEDDDDDVEDDEDR